MLLPSTVFSACGGARLEREVGTLLRDSRTWGAISITQSIKVAPRVASAFFRLAAELRRGEPGLFVPIDFGFMNVRLSKVAKRHGWKVLTFVPPGSWRRDRQGREVARLSDAIATPFSWSAELLEQLGAKDVHWFGHPIKQILREGLVGNSNGRLDQIAFLPGSRHHELELNLPILAEVVRPGEVVEFGLAPNVDLEHFKANWKALTGRNDTFTVGQTAAVLRRSRAGIVCSGTATLEAALCRTPMVVIYASSKAMVREAKLVGWKRPQFIALPNILLGRAAVPEFIVGAHSEATPEDLRTCLDQILSSPIQQLADFEELDAMLGSDDAITQTAELAAQLLTAKA
jgi:lipid-A-disaccharide synthase